MSNHPEYQSYLKRVQQYEEKIRNGQNPTIMEKINYERDRVVVDIMEGNGKPGYYLTYHERKVCGYGY